MPEWDSFVLHLQQERVRAFAENPKTEVFLNLLLWSADKLMQPTCRNSTVSYESGAYRSGLAKQVS